jgi:serine/threonine protein kinase
LEKDIGSKPYHLSEGSFTDLKGSMTTTIIQMFSRGTVRRINFEPIFVEDCKSKPLLKLNQYLLSGRLGRGANSVVHLAIDTETNSETTAKAIHLGSNGAFLEREIGNLRRLNHPNIVKTMP